MQRCGSCPRHRRPTHCILDRSCRTSVKQGWDRHRSIDRHRQRHSMLGKDIVTRFVSSSFFFFSYRGLHIMTTLAQNVRKHLRLESLAAGGGLNTVLGNHAQACNEPLAICHMHAIMHRFLVGQFHDLLETCWLKAIEAGFPSYSITVRTLPHFATILWVWVGTVSFQL